MDTPPILAELVKIIGDRWSSWDRARDEAHAAFPKSGQSGR